MMFIWAIFMIHRFVKGLSRHLSKPSSTFSLIVLLMENKLVSITPTWEENMESQLSRAFLEELQ